MPVLPLFASVQTEFCFSQLLWYNLVLGYRKIFLLSVKDVVHKARVDHAITWKAAAYGVWLGWELDNLERLQIKGPSGSLSLNPCYGKKLSWIIPFQRTGARISSARQM